VLSWTKIVGIDPPAPGDCGVSQTVPDLEQDLDGARFGQSMVWMLTALQLESASELGVHGTEDRPVRRLEFVRMTGWNKPEPDSETCRVVSDLRRSMGSMTVQDMGLQGAQN
jgi:hypothetical protein